MINLRLLMISICVLGLVACNTGTQKKIKDGIPDTKSKDYVFIIKNKTKLEIGESFELRTEINAPVYWLLPNNVKKDGQSFSFSFSSSGRKEIKMIAKETGEVLASTLLNVRGKQSVEVVIPPEETLVLSKDKAPVASDVPIYQRYFKSKQEITNALEQLANSGMKKRKKKGIRNKILADLDQAAKIRVNGTDEIASIYLRNIILQASEYKSVQIKLDWVIDSKTNKISQIIIL